MDNGFALLDVTVRGPGEPEIVVIGGVHGNETGGVRALSRYQICCTEYTCAVGKSRVSNMN